MYTSAVIAVPWFSLGISFMLVVSVLYSRIFMLRASAISSSFSFKCVLVMFVSLVFRVSSATRPNLSFVSCASHMAQATPAETDSPSSPSFLASTQCVMEPGGMRAYSIGVAYGGRMLDTGTRLHWSMRAETRALSNAFSLLVVLNPVPEVVKNFL